MRTEVQRGLRRLRPLILKLETTVYLILSVRMKPGIIKVLEIVQGIIEIGVKREDILPLSSIRMDCHNVNPNTF